MSLPLPTVALPPLPARLRRFFAESVEWLRALQSSHAGVCPRCQGKAMRRSRIRWYESWRKAFPARPHRCEACCHRTWLRPEGVEVTHSSGLMPHESAMRLTDDREMDLTLLDEGPSSLGRPTLGGAAFLSEAHADSQVLALVRALEERLSELGPTPARLTTSREVLARIRRT